MKRLVFLICLFCVVVAIGTFRAISAIKLKETKNQFRNIYTLYSSALQYTVDEMSGDIGCYYSSTGESDVSGCEKFYKHFVENLKVKKYCQNDALAENCVPVYKSYTTSSNCLGFSEEMINKHDDVFVMDNDSNIIVYNTENGKRAPFFAVDVNGLKEPNTPGQDLFTILIMKNSGGAYYFHSNITYCLPVEKGGIENIQDIYK